MALYNSVLSLSLDTLAPLKTKSVSFTRPAPWYTSELRAMKAWGRQLERLHKRTGLTVHLLAFKDHAASYKEALSWTKTQYFSTLIRSQENHPKTLFTTINRLLRPPADPLPPDAGDLCPRFLDFFQAKVDSIHQQLLTPIPPPSHPTQSHAAPPLPLSPQPLAAVVSVLY